MSDFLRIVVFRVSLFKDSHMNLFFEIRFQESTFVLFFPLLFDQSEAHTYIYIYTQTHSASWDFYTAVRLIWDCWYSIPYTDISIPCSYECSKHLEVTEETQEVLFWVPLCLRNLESRLVLELSAWLLSPTLTSFLSWIWAGCQQPRGAGGPSYQLPEPGCFEHR